MLHVIERLNDFGGTARKLSYLVEYGLRRSGPMLFLVYRPSNFSHHFERLGATVLTLNSTSPLKLGSNIARICRDQHVDVLCTHFTRPLVAGLAISKALRIPQVHHEHGPAQLRKPSGDLAARYCLPHVDRIICNSSYTADTISRRYPGTRAKLAVVHNPVVMRRAKRSRSEIRESCGIGTENIVVGHVGGLTRWRDHQTLLRGFARAYDRHPNLRMILVGDGPCRDELVGLGKSLKIEDRIHFVGYQQDIGAYLSAMDLYVNPALAEGFGIAVVEAMLSKLPVILADSGAHPELISHTDSGLLYTAGDASALSEALSKMVESRAIRDRIGEQGYRTATNRFTPKCFVENYLSEIERAVGAVREPKCP